MLTVSATRITWQLGIRFLFVFITMLPGMSYGFYHASSGGRSAAMANASVALWDFWALQNNQAGLAFIQRPAAGLFYENRFMLRELSFNQAGCAIPSSYGTVGLSVSYFGFRLYNETKIGLAYARAWGENFATSIQLDYLHIGLGDIYGSKGVPTFEIGLLSKLTPRITLGAHVFNPVHSKLMKYNDERLPVTFRSGLAWQIDQAIVLCSEIHYETQSRPDVRFGAEYLVAKNIFVRGGLSTNPDSYTFGCGFVILDNLKADFAASIHSILGFSPHISLIYEFGKKQ